MRFIQYVDKEYDLPNFNKEPEIYYKTKFVTNAKIKNSKLKPENSNHKQYRKQK